MFVKVFYHLVKVSVIVVDDSPAEAPAWEGIDLRNSTCTDYGDLLGQISHGNELGIVFIHKSIVYLVGNDRYLKLVCDLQYLELMLLAEACAARI